MKVLGVIPARYASSRFPGKPLIDIKGKSMIQRVFEQCQKCSTIDKVVVATDNTEIFDHVSKFGEVVMTSSEHENGTDRVAEVAEKFPDFDIVINVQGDEPLIEPKQIDQLADLLKREEVGIGTLAKKENSADVLSNPNRVKVVFDVNGKAMYFSRSRIAFQRTNVGLDSFRHIGIYGFKRASLNKVTKLPVTLLEQTEGLEQLRWMYHGESVHVAETEFETPNVDVPEDVVKVLEHLETKS